MQVSEAQIRKRAESRLSMLRTERSNWEGHWKAISRVLLPRSGRFATSDRKGGQRHNSIIDATGTYALQVLQSGMMAGATSPARRWFAIQLEDPERNKRQDVQEWLGDVTERMWSAIGRTNFYRAMPQFYLEQGAFGTGVTYVRPMPAPRLLHLYPLTVGEYYLGQSDLHAVDTLYREFDMTAGQIAEQWPDTCSDTVKRQVKNGEIDHWHTVVHAIEPRSEYDPRRLDFGNMPWRSLYYEKGAPPDRILQDHGHRLFPALASPWAKAAGLDVYGQSPAMVTLGAIEQLQHQQLRKGQAIDFQTQPPTQGPAIDGREMSLFPGAHNVTTGGGEITPLYRADLDLSHLTLDMSEVRQRIERGFFSDLFLMLANSDRRQMTAAEVAERHEEKLLMLGPVLENLHDTLRHFLDLLYERMADEGMLPPPPADLVDAELSVEFVSILAQAQRAIGVNQMDRFLVSVGGLVNIGKTEALDRIDVDEVVDQYARMLGVPPKIILDRVEVERVRIARNQALAAKEQIAAMQGASQATRGLSQSTVGGPQQNLLDAVPMLTGYGQPAQ